MTTGADIVATARQQLGKPYVWGATGPGSFDCSGLTHYVYAAHGIEIGRDTAAQQRDFGQLVAPEHVQPGDLVFFGDLAGPRAHVGIVVGADRMIDAPHGGASVREESISGWASSGEALRGFRRYTAPLTEADLPLNADDLSKITTIVQQQIANETRAPNGAIFRLMADLFNNQFMAEFKKIENKIGA